MPSHHIFFIFLSFAPLPFLSAFPHLFLIPLHYSPQDLCASTLYIPHPPSPRCPLYSISQTFHLSLSFSLSFPAQPPVSPPAHVGKYICRQQKADSLPLSFSSPPPPLRHPTHVISTGCLSHAPAFQPAAANEPLCERTERERQRGREERNPVTVRKLNLERLSACHNKAHGTHSVALKWKITSPGHTPASFLPPPPILVEL